MRHFYYIINSSNRSTEKQRSITITYLGTRGADLAYARKIGRIGKYQIPLYGLVIAILGRVLYKGVLIPAWHVYRRKRDSSGHVYLRKH